MNNDPTTATTRYVAAGNVRGWCGHRHLSVGAADACAAADRRDCAKAGGYSDRDVYEASQLSTRVDGDLYVPAGGVR